MNQFEILQNLHEQLIADSPESQRSYILGINNGSRYIKLSPIAYQLLQQRCLGASFEEIAKQINEQTGQYKSTVEIEAAYQHIIDKITQFEYNSSLKETGFLFRKTLLPKRLVCWLASFMSVAFYQPVGLFLIGVVATAITILLHQDLAVELSPINLIIGFILFIVSSLVHELGHASACMRYGASPSEIGFTIYWIYPAFFTNVNSAWQLKRWQRVIVDIGGIFFQLVVCSLYIFIYLATSFSSLKVAKVMIIGSCLFSLNPIFKFDGYWIISDALGVANLSQQPNKILRYSINRLLDRSTQPLPWSQVVTFILRLYTILSIGFWSYFLLLFIPLLYQYILHYPGLVLKFTQALTHPPYLPSTETGISLLISTFIVIVGILFIWRLVRQLPSLVKELFF